MLGSNCGAVGPSPGGSFLLANRPALSFYSLIQRLVTLVAGGLFAALVVSCGGNGNGNSNNATASKPTLTLTPANFSLTAGTTGQSASLLLTAPGASGVATVTVSGLPSGVTTAPATLSLSPGIALNLVMTAGPATAATTTMVTFTASAGGQTASTQGSLVVNATPPPPDFSLTINPASASLVANGTPAQVSLLAAAQNGFSGNVLAAVSGLPMGITAQPASFTLTPGTPTTVTLTAAAGTAATTGTVIFTGTAGSLSHMASLPISVSAPPAAAADFSLNLSPQALSVAPGGTGQAIQVAAAALNGFTGATGVAVSGLPAGVTANPASLSLAPGVPQTVTLTAANSAQAATANVAFTGTAGSLTHTATLALTVTAAAGTSVTTYHNDNARDGWNATETTLTPQNVNATTFGKLREFAVDGKVDAQPLYVSSLSFGGQTHNVLITVTEHDSVYAFDADAGTQLWQISSLEANETSSDSHNCGQISPEIGITDTPVIDRAYGANGAVFFVAMSKDSAAHYHQRLHALDLTTGAELPGSPAEIAASYPGTGYGSSNGMQVFDPGQYAERVGLLLMNGQIYMAWTSHCDQDPYTGWLMAYNESTLQQSSVFNLTPNGPTSPHYANGEGSVWMSGAGLGADTQGNIFFLDANGTFDSTLDSHGFPAGGDFGNSFMKISTAGNKLAAADYFAASNTQAESDADQDLGSGGAMLLPDLTDAGGATRHLAVGAGKDTNLYVVDRDNMGKFSPSSNSAIYQEVPGGLGGPVFSMPAFFNNTVYYAAVGDHLRAFPVTQARLATASTAQSANTFGFPGATPSVSSNGTQNGILWAIENQNGAGVLHAYDPTNLAVELYDSNQAPSNRDHFIDNKYVPPTIANGKVFVGTTNSVAVFGLLP
jgi:hypothetical protein